MKSIQKCKLYIYTDQEDASDSGFPQQVEVHTIVSFDGLHRFPHTALSMSLAGKTTVYENEVLLLNLQ